jgi:ATP/maltotriose-dependent transcriptional regulator MalT
VPSPRRAASGVLSHYQGDYDRADELCGSALELFRALGEQKGVAEAVTGLALVRRTRGDYRGAEALFREALSIYEDLGAEAATAWTLYRSGIALALGGEADRARPLFERSHELSRRLGDSTGVALGLQGLAFSRAPGADPEARVQVEESLDILRGLGDRRNVAKVLVVAADINADLGDTEMAAGQLAEALTLFVEFGDRWFWGWSIETAACLAATVGESERAARLFGAADAVWAAIEAPLPAKLHDRHARVLADAGARLGQDRFEAARVEGRNLPIGATIELVQPTERRAAGDIPEGLTAREVEVLALVSEGLTDAQVAERLVVSIRTVHAHLRSIYRKLDVRTRSAATRYALQHDLVA